MKQTAVEWLESEMLKPNLSVKEIIEKAKEMEKQQIIDSNFAGIEFIAVNPSKYNEEAKQYFKDNFEQINTKPLKPLLANRLLKFRFWGNFGELNEEEDICEMEMLYGDKFCFYESEPINDLFACRNFQVMQFTGFKDKNDKEIYEGDILEYVHFANALIKRRVAVEFDIECGGWYVTKHFEYLSDLLHKQHNEVFKKSQGYESSSNHNVVVIGNIYENPELLQTTS